MQTSRSSLIFALITGLAALFAIFALPREDSGACIVALVCAMAGVVAISFLKDARERLILTRMFLAAFTIRIAFCFMLFKSGLTQAFAGGDDAVWELGWLNSRIWRGWIRSPGS